jgi:hypothetical protein
MVWANKMAKSEGSYTRDKNTTASERDSFGAVNVDLRVHKNSGTEH